MYESMKMSELRKRYEEVTGLKPRGDDGKFLTRIFMEKVVFPKPSEKGIKDETKKPKKVVKRKVEGKVKCIALKDWTGFYGVHRATLSRGVNYNLSPELYKYLKISKVVV